MFLALAQKLVPSANRHARRIQRSTRPALTLTALENRTTPAVIDVTGVGAGAFSTDENVFVRHVNIDPTGTGLIDPFLRVHRQGVEHGYNTDYRASGNPSQDLLDDITDTNFTNATTLGSIREVRLDASGNIVTTGGELYREFRLDLGEPGNATSESGLINLSRLEFFTSTSAVEHVTNNTWVSGVLGTATPRYNLENSAVGGDDFTLRDLTSGNGALDYAVYVKSSLFAGAASTDFLYLYSMFGGPAPAANGTFEEWSAELPANSPPPPPPPPPPPQNGSISGFKWEDSDGDGEWDTDESGLAGWTIYLSNGTGTASTSTDTNGRYTFGNLTPGSYTISEFLDPEWTNTYSGLTTVVLSGGMNVSGDSGVAEPLNFGNFENVDIIGGGNIKFEDKNGNGVKDSGDDGLDGWTINLYRVVGNTNVYVTSAITADGGVFFFNNVGPGTYFVQEASTGQPWDSFTQTYGTAGYTFTASSGVNDVTDMAFGNFKNVVISGMKFEDHDGDGVKDAGDQGLQGWVILVNGQPAGVTTDADGNWTYTAGPGTYSFQEVNQTGWTQTFGNAGYGVTVGGSGIGSGGTSTGNDFGNFENVCLSGVKWEDHDGDGVRDAEDQGLAGWHILVNGVDVATTAADGSWSVCDLGPGSYFVQEAATGQPWNSFTQTYGKAGYTVAARSGEDDTDNDFGNFKNITISGVKFYDADADGVRDAGEVGINGWNFGLDTNGDSVPDVFATTSGGTAATGGTFSFANLGPGTYTVYELNGLTGTWLPTTSTTAGAFVAVSGGNVTTHDFGNVKLGAGGGLTLGFWSNKNGENTMKAGPGGMAGALAMLSGLNLRTATGADFNPTTYAQFRSWILGATATNMANMLSAQLAAMSLNVYESKVNGGSMIYAPGTTSANAFGFATVSAVMAEANTELGLHGLVLADSPYRNYQESLKNALDRANNNLNFIIGFSGWHDDNNNGVIDSGEI